MFWKIFLGCAVFCITNFSLLYVSHLLVRRFFSKTPPSVRLLAIGTLFYSFIILTFQTLSPFHAITKTWVSITCFLLALVSHLAWGSYRNFNADIEPIRIWIKEGFSSRWSALIIFCGFVVVLSLSRALLMPPLAWDSLSYHLTFAAQWIQKGTLFLFQAPDQIMENVYFPINGDIFTSWLILPFNSDLLVNTVNFPITLLGGIACYAITRELGLNRREASFAPALICFASMIYVQITTQYVDNSVFAFCTVSVLFSLRYLRRGDLLDALLAFIATGILIGIKYSSIPMAGIIIVALILKTLFLAQGAGFIKKVSLLLVGLSLICVLGGRQYIQNSIEGRNPLYPFPLKIGNYQLFDGSEKLDQVNEGVAEYEKNTGIDKLSLWEREYKKFLYTNRSAGPKFFLFLILAIISLIIRPRDIPKRDWYFLGLLWIVPVAIFYSDSPASFTRKAAWIVGSTRFLSPAIALFTIQSLVFIKRFSKYSTTISFLFAAFITWDILFTNTTHLWEVEVLFPYVILLVFLFGVILAIKRLRSSLLNRNDRYQITLPSFFKFSYQNMVMIVGIFALAGGFYLLQNYRDNTRYNYFKVHYDYVPINEVSNLSAGWEFLDHPDEKKTIALTLDWSPPGHRWFFYPLMGRWLQNDIVYISAKYKWEVPAWQHKGMLRGDDFSVWLSNLEQKKVDYIFVMKPWPVELKWMEQDSDKFQLVFLDPGYKIFMYRGESA